MMRKKGIDHLTKIYCKPANHGHCPLAGPISWSVLSVRLVTQVFVRVAVRGLCVWINDFLFSLWAEAVVLMRFQLHQF